MKIHLLGTGAGNPSPTRYNSCAVLETAGGLYMIDAGGPTMGLMRRAGLDPAQLKAVFVSHMHEDHFGGISSILKNRCKYLPAGEMFDVWLPDGSCGEVINAFINLSVGAARHYPTEHLRYHSIHTGAFFDDGNVKVSAFPNDHLACEKFFNPSFGFRFECGGRVMLYTGDLAADFHDFPEAECQTAHTCVTELTHYPLDTAFPVFERLPLEQLLFTHVAMAHAPIIEANRDRFPYKVAVANDGDCFEV